MCWLALRGLQARPSRFRDQWLEMGRVRLACPSLMTTSVVRAGTLCRGNTRNRGEAMRGQQGWGFTRAARQC